ncbi:MAG: hypothetical protein M1820_009882 [Bogoriella megaspora]|nr:MAG: hypothetical protein M1820_009882 [Bogoriella megaspora]
MTRDGHLFRTDCPVFNKEVGTDSGSGCKNDIGTIVLVAMVVFVVALLLGLLLIVEFDEQNESEDDESERFMREFDLTRGRPALLYRMRRAVKCDRRNGAERNRSSKRKYISTQEKRSLLRGESEADTGEGTGAKENTNRQLNYGSIV